MAELAELELTTQQVGALDRLLTRLLDDDTAEFLGLATPDDLAELVWVHRQIVAAQLAAAVEGVAHGHG